MPRKWIKKENPTPHHLRHYIHGLSPQSGPAPIYVVYKTMLARCLNPKNHKYESYGGRGITICRRWRESILNFVADMGQKPTPFHQLGRIDNNGHYSPENCRWETRKQQARNRRDNHFLEFQGKRATLAEWVEITGIPYHTLKRRVNVLGWGIERALMQPVKSWKTYAKANR